MKFLVVASGAQPGAAAGS